MAVPVAVKLATVAELQKVCDAVPVGAGELIVTVTSNLEALSQPLMV